MIRTSNPTRRERKHAARHEALLDEAMAIVQDGGTDKLTMARLADRADAAVGALYRYFSGKDALLAALQLRAVRRFGDVLAERLVAPVSPLDRLLVVCAAWPGFASSEPALFALIERSLTSPQRVLSDDAARNVDDGLGAVLGQVAQALDVAVHAGVLQPGDTALRTHALWAAVHGATHLTKRDRVSQVAALSVREELERTLLVGWGAQRSEVEAAQRRR
jgi:AcrR family transcriptional regulator